MPLPSDIGTCRLTFGPYVDLTGHPIYVGMKGSIHPTVTVRHTTDGTVLDTLPVEFALDNTGSATVTLPFTDSPVLTPRGFTYSVSWLRGRSTSSPGMKMFQLPTALGATATFSHLEPASDGSGVLVPVAVGPPGVPGPPGIADDASIAAQIAPGTATWTALNASFVRTAQLVIGPTRPTNPAPGTVYINNS